MSRSIAYYPVVTVVGETSTYFCIGIIVHVYWQLVAYSLLIWRHYCFFTYIAGIMIFWRPITKNPSYGRHRLSWHVPIVAPITRICYKKNEGTNLLTQSCFFMSFEIEEFLHFFGSAIQWLNSCGRGRSIVEQLRGRSMVERPCPWTKDRPGNWSCQWCQWCWRRKKLHRMVNTNMATIWLTRPKGPIQ